MARITTTPNAFVHIINNLVDLKNDCFEFDLLCSEEEYGYFLKEKYHFNVIFTPIMREISILNDLKSVWNLYNIFRKNKYSIVHSSTPKGGLVTAIAGLLSFTPIRLHTFTGQRWAISKGPKRFLLKAIDRLIIRLNTNCYADSRSQVSFLIKEGVAKPGEVLCLGEGSYGGVDTQKFNSELYPHSKSEISKKYNVPINPPWILYVGRITKDKGIEELIHAFPKIHNAEPCELVLIGTIEDLDPSIVSVILSHPNIHHLGFQKNPAQFMAASYIQCMPSYREGFGTVVIEAAAMGVPTIGTNIPGLQDSIQDELTGLLIPVFDSEALVASTIRLLRDKNLRDHLGRNAEIRAREVFSSDTMSKLLKNAYSDLITKIHKYSFFLQI